MKKLIAASIILLSLLPIFADSGSTTITTGESSDFSIKGFFEGTTQTTYAFMVWTDDPVTDRIYHSGDIVLRNLTSLEGIPVFNWELQWSSGTNLTLSFTFTPLQSFTGRLYYIPAHTYRLTCNGQPDKSIVFGSTATGTFPFPGAYASESAHRKSVNYSTVVSSGVGSMTGACYLSVNEYETTVADDFVYTTYIRVEFGVI